MLVQARYENKQQRARQQGASWPAVLPPILKNTRNPGGSGPVHHFICSFIQQIFIEHMLCAGNSEGSRAGMVPASKCAGGLPTLTGSAGDSSNSIQLWGCQLCRRGGWCGAGGGEATTKSWFPKARLKACSPDPSSFCLLCPFFLF